LSEKADPKICRNAAPVHAERDQLNADQIYPTTEVEIARAGSGWARGKSSCQRGDGSGNSRIAPVSRSHADHWELRADSRSIGTVGRERGPRSAAPKQPALVTGRDAFQTAGCSDALASRGRHCTSGGWRTNHFFALEVSLRRRLVGPHPPSGGIAEP
jgi:hypothetical protein